MVWEKGRVGRTPPSIFWGQRIQRKFEFLSKILYRQVHWCAALFCRTSPVKPVRTPVAILGSLGVCIYVPASRHRLISYSPIHLT